MNLFEKMQQRYKKELEEYNKLSVDTEKTLTGANGHIETFRMEGINRIAKPIQLYPSHEESLLYAVEEILKELKKLKGGENETIN